MKRLCVLGLALLVSGCDVSPTKFASMAIDVENALTSEAELAYNQCLSSNGDGCFALQQRISSVANAIQTFRISADIAREAGDLEGMCTDLGYVQRASAAEHALLGVSPETLAKAAKLSTLTITGCEAPT